MQRAQRRGTSPSKEGAGLGSCGGWSRDEDGDGDEDEDAGMRMRWGDEDRDETRG